MAVCRYLPIMLAVIFLAGISGQANAAALQDVRPLAWTEIDKPNINGETILAPSEINRLAASHDVVYALDTINYRLHRSDNGGLTFKEITAALATAGATLPGWEIAVAPDRAQYVAVVTDNRTRVYLSDDSGATWYAIPDISHASGEQIQCIAISTGYLSGTKLMHDMAVGTADWNNHDSGKIWTYQVGSSFGGWTDQAIAINSITGANVSAIAFSPQYSADSTMLAVAVSQNGSSDNTTYLCLGARDLNNQTTTWKTDEGYPMPFVCNAPNQSPPLSSGDAGSSNILSYISLPSDYGGTDAKTRLAFLGYNSDNTTNPYRDVYRIDDDASPPVQRLNVAGGASVDISSIAYFGTLASGKLLAGLADTKGTNVSQVKWTISPLGTGTVGSTVWYDAYQPPSGPGNTQVAWSNSGSVAFCGTGISQDLYPPPPPQGPLYDESAFSQSQDNGNTWVQTCLINTNLFMCDIAPAPDSKSLFMATYSEFGPESVWRCAGEPLGRYWGRLLNMPSDTNRVILRLSPGYRTDYTLYAAEVDSELSENISMATRPSNILEISENRGNTWKQRMIPRPVIDVVAAGQYTLYLATTGGYVRKSTDGGLTWGDKVPTDLTDINMLAVSDNGSVFAGSRDGWVAYSTNGGASFTKIAYPVSSRTTRMSGNMTVQVEPDVNYDTNNIIYASENVSDVGVWRWVIGQSNSWEQIDQEITDLGTGEKISGLRVGPEDTLYALRAEPVKLVKRKALSGIYSENCTSISDNRTGGMNRTLNPADLFYLIEWDTVNRTLSDNVTPAYIAFDPAPLGFAGNLPWLKFSGDANENDLWAIDTSNGANDNTTGIYVFRDNICKAGPWTTAPSEVGCDPVSGTNQGLDLSWEQLSLSDRYDLQIAKDPDFTLKVNPKISNSDNISSVAGSISIKTDLVNVTSPAVWLSPGALPEAGAVYYWRIRTYHAATGEYIISPWSDTGSFLVKPGFPVDTGYYSPLPLSPYDGCGACKAPISFTWSPYKETTLYKFELSDRADMSRPLISVNADTTALVYIGQLKYDTAYFWRVRAVEPAPSDYSSTFSFHTGTAAAAVPVPASREAQAVPLWAKISFIIGILAIIVMLLLIFCRRGILPW